MGRYLFKDNEGHDMVGFIRERYMRDELSLVEIGGELFACPGKGLATAIVQNFKR